MIDTFWLVLYCLICGAAVIVGAGIAAYVDAKSSGFDEREE